MRIATTALLSVLPLLSAAYEIRPFRINLSSRVPHLKDLVQRTKLPATSVLGSAGAGIDLGWLKSRQADWLEKFDWEKEQASLNKYASSRHFVCLPQMTTMSTLSDSTTLPL